MIRVAKFPNTVNNTLPTSQRINPPNASKLIKTKKAAGSTKINLEKESAALFLCSLLLPCDIGNIQHVFDKNSIPLCGISNKNVGHRADELTVLNYRAARQVCDQVGTTVFNKKFKT
jgi:hypothetical protein